MFDKARDKARQAATGVVAAALDKAASGDELDDFKRANAAAAMGDRGQTGAGGAVNLVVALVVGGLMAAFLLPIAIDEIADVDTTGWDGGAAALWDILPVMIVLAVFLFFVGIALRRSGRI